MACTLPYIQNSQLSETEKSKLEGVHLDILNEAKASGAFRREDDQYVTLKNTYAKATEFIGKIRTKYGQLVATLPEIGGGKHALNVNVLPLAGKQERDISFFQGDEALLEQEEKDLFFQTDDFKQDSEKIAKVVSNLDVNKTLLGFITPSNLDATLKEAGFDQDMITKLSNFYNDNRKLMYSAPNVYELVNAYTSAKIPFGGTQMAKKADKQLEIKLLKWLEPLGITIKDIEDFKKNLNVNSLGIADIINKTIYLAKDRQKDTLPEEVGHFYVEFLEKRNKRGETREYLLYRDLINKIESWSEYQKYYDIYSKIYVKNGVINEEKVKKEIIGKAIAEAVVRRFETKDQGLYSLIQELIDFLRSIFKSRPMLNIQSLADDIAEKILSEDYSDIKKELPKDVKLRDYKSVPKEVRDIIHSLSTIGATMTGSISLRKAGTIYRGYDEEFHDLDFKVPPGTNQEEFLEKVKKVYPSLMLKSEFESNGSLTTLWTIKVNGKLYDIDFFFEGKPYNISDSFVHWSDTFAAKLDMGRTKDVTDFINYVPSKKFSLFPKKDIIIDDYLYYQVDEEPVSNKAVDDMYDKLIDIDSRMELIPEVGEKGKPGYKKRHYTLDKEEVAQSVTEYIKGQEKEKFAEGRTPEQQYEDEQKRLWGSEGHEYIAKYISKNLIDKNGYALKNTKNGVVGTKLDERVVKKLQDFAKDLILSYKPGTRFLIEKMIVNQKRKGMLGSTMDFVAIEPAKDSFNMNILDWKFMSRNNPNEQDVPWYKQGEWNKQMKEYTYMVYNLGVTAKQLKKAWMVPFAANYTAKKDSKDLVLTSIEIGNLKDNSDTELYLLPVPLETESTGIKSVDKLAQSLQEYHKKIYDIIVSPEEKSLKKEKLNKLSMAIRSLRLKKDFAPLYEVGETFLKNAKEVFDQIEALDMDKLTLEQINTKAGELLQLEQSAHKFASLDEVFLSVFPKEDLDMEDLALLSKLEHLSSATERMLYKIRGTRENPEDGLFQKIAMQIAIKGGYTTENKAKNILAPEAVIENLPKTFLEASKLPSKIIQIASNLIQKAKNLVDLIVVDKVNQFAPLLLDLEKEASSMGKSAFDLIGESVHGKLQLFSKHSKDFKQEIFAAKKAKNKKFYLSNIDKAKYDVLAKQAINKRIADKEKETFSSDEMVDNIKRQAAVKQIQQSLDIDRADFNGFNDYDFKRIFWETLKEQDSMYSEEYKKMPESAKKVWEFFTELNERAYKSGYINYKQRRTFFPLMEATIAEKLYKSNNVLAEGQDILKDLYSIRAEEEQGYSKIDKETGKLKKSVPKLFTRSNKEASQLSTDLNKVGVIWIKSLMEFESNRELENTLLLLSQVEKNKGNLIKDSSNATIWENGEPKITDEESKNAAILDTIIDDAIYGLKENLSSIGNIGLSTVTDKTATKSTEEEKEKYKLQSKKILNNANKLVQGLAVGWRWLVTVPNYVGFNMQAIINAGRLTTWQDFQKNHAKVLSGKVGGLSLIEKALINQIIPLNDNLTLELRRQIAKKEGLVEYLNTWTFYDTLMATNSFPDKLLQMANALSIMENTIVVDGILVNIRQYLSAQDRKKYNLSFAERKELEKSFKSRVEALKEKSIVNLATIKDDGSIDIPGVNTKELAKLRLSIIEYSRNLSGQMSENNKADFRRDTILKSFMMFKGWIPKQVSVRTLDIHKNYELDQWEYGRTRAFVKTLQHIGWLNIKGMRDIILGTEEGIQRLKEIYDAKKEAYYLKTGQELEITEEEFYDLMRNELKSQSKELILVLSLIGMVLAVKMAEPPEDEEDALLNNRYKMFAKVSNKVADELWFYYNPLSMESMTRGSILPALGILTKANRVLIQTGTELYGEATDNEDLVDKTHPRKYLFNMIPGVSQIQNDIMPIIDPEWAKEQGIRVSAEARAMR